MIVNRSYDIPPQAKAGTLLADASRRNSPDVLRWHISKAGPRGYHVESTECTAAAPPSHEIPAGMPERSGKAAVISLIPTGVGCSIGGYAGDAGPVTTLLSAAADLVITNPNAVNASNLIALGQGIIYTEGYSLDLFSSGRAQLYVPHANKIGVIVEKAPDEALIEVINTINAVRAVHGIDIVDYIVTDEPVGNRCLRQDSGAYAGQIDRPDRLLSAGRRLLAAGATALAVTTNVQDLPAQAYASHFAGAHPNPVGGAEAIVSHLLTRSLGVPCAHAPMLNFKAFPGGHQVVDARGAGEFISTSGLACVLIGLRRAPQLYERPGHGIAAVIGIGDVMAVIAPATALGSLPVLAAAQRGTPIIAVQANTTILDVTAERLGLPDVIKVDNYLEASGVVLALRAGLSLEAVRRPLATLAAPHPSAVTTPNGRAMLLVRVSGSHPWR